jgi:glucosamine-6-phosphate deaminase
MNMNHRSKSYDNLQVQIYPTRDAMGKASAEHVASVIRDLHARRDYVNMIFAAAPSQDEFLYHLTQLHGIEWGRVIGFHMDEYFSLPADSNQLFSKYLKDHLFSKVRMKEVHVLEAAEEDPIQVCKKYSDLLRSHLIDIACLGIGENGHIAFNDPPVADFNDPLLVKVVELDEPCRQQQVNDGCFTSVAEVPTHAITLTVPQLMSASYLNIVVPSERKATAVRDALLGPVSTKVPASILRYHVHAMMFIDEPAAACL